MTQPELLLRSRKFCVERRQFEAAGTVHTADIIVHPGAAVVLPLLDDGRVVLIRNHRVAVGTDLLELPAGTLDPGEEPRACAARELTEETGYRAAELRPLCAFYSSPGLLTERMHVFVARGLTPGPAQLEPGERIRSDPRPLEEALAAIRSGQICDAKTIVALLYYECFGRRPGDGP